MLSTEFNMDDALRVREKDGEQKKAEKIAINLLDILDIETIAKKTELSIERVRELKNKYEQMA